MDEFRAQVIRDIADTPHMRSEVTVIPMRRDVMKIPGLESGPQVTWTDENAVDFLQLLGNLNVKLPRKIAMNCWKLSFNETISSQALPVMA